MLYTGHHPPEESPRSRCVGLAGWSPLTLVLQEFSSPSAGSRAPCSTATRTATRCRMAALSDRSGDRCVSRGRWPRPPGCEQQVKGQGRIVAGWCAVLAVQRVLPCYPLLTGSRARLVELHQRARVGDLLRKSGTRAGGWDECAPSAAGHERALVLGFLPFPAGPGGAKRTGSKGQREGAGPRRSPPHAQPRALRRSSHAWPA